MQHGTIAQSIPAIWLRPQHRAVHVHLIAVMASA
jgi:hypothetical protein